MDFSLRSNKEKLLGATSKKGRKKRTGMGVIGEVGLDPDVYVERCPS